MTDPPVWSDLEARFRKLATDFGDTLTAEWCSTPWKPDGDHWMLSRRGLFPVPDPDFEKDLFISLAERAAVNLFPTMGKSPHAWLDHLRENSSRFKDNGPKEIQRDGVVIDKYTSGIIERPCQASADSCFKLETDAMAARLGGDAPGPVAANQVLAGASTAPPIEGQASEANLAGATPPAKQEEAFTPNRACPKAVVDAARRKLKKRSYEKFAAQMCISKDTLYAITLEKRWVSDEIYILVAEVCGCEPEHLHPRDIPKPERRRG